MPRSQFYNPKSSGNFKSLSIASGSHPDLTRFKDPTYWGPTGSAAPMLLGWSWALAQPAGKISEIWKGSGPRRETWMRDYAPVFLFFLFHGWGNRLGREITHPRVTRLRSVDLNPRLPALHCSKQWPWLSFTRLFLLPQSWQEAEYPE